MKKSKLFFVTMALTYVIIAVLNLWERISVSENILFGLSMSALLSALSDIFSNLVGKCTSQNEFDYIIRVTSEFLTNKISNNMLDTPIDSRNVRLNVENMSKGYKVSVHPNEYCKRKLNVLYDKVSKILFILSIVSFIFAPFPLGFFLQSYSVFLTLLAFASMCLNLFLEELISDIIQKKTLFLRDTQLIIQMAYPDFLGYLNFRFSYYEDYLATTNMQEGKTNAHA